VSDRVQTPGEKQFWELATPLLHVAAGTLLAPGATIHTPRPWVPSGRAGVPGAPRWVLAALLTAEVDGVTTRFAFGRRRPPRALVVRLDRRRAGARITAVRTECEGATLGDAQIVRSGDRVDLVLPVRQIARGTGALSVRVTCGDDWRLAGVVAQPETARACASALAQEPHVRLQQITPRVPSGHPVNVFVKPAPLRRPT